MANGNKPHPVLYIGGHAAAAGAFMYLLQTFVWKAPNDRALMWAGAFALAAAVLAWTQLRR